MLMKRATTWGALLTLAVSASLTWAVAAQDRLPAGDLRFVNDVAQDGMAEVKLGQYAADHGTAAAVKDFGQRMVRDHTKANDELMALAKNKGVTPPADLGRHQAVVDRMTKLSGDGFDKSYASHMVGDHVAAIAMFRREAQNGQDADVKAWAAKTLPTLQEHLRMARDMATAVGAPVGGRRQGGAGAGASDSGANGANKGGVGK